MLVCAKQKQGPKIKTLKKKKVKHLVIKYQVPGSKFLRIVPVIVMYRTYEIVTLGDKITHPLGRFSKQGFLDNGEGVLSTTTNDASICAILLDGILIFPEPSFSVFACPLPSLEHPFCTAY